jgi:hypothetical protein
MLKKIGLGIAVVVVALVVFVSMQPGSFAVERSITMQAPVDIAYGLVSDFHAWENWSPWAKLDPNMKTTYEGPGNTEGSSYSWEGSKEVGKGRMTMTALKPAQSVEIKLEFLAPFQATNRTLFSFAPQGDATNVTWRMEGTNSFAAKALHLVVDMDKMVGKDFEKGLASMKALAEAAAQKRQAEVAAAAKPAAAEGAAPGVAPGK